MSKKPLPKIKRLGEAKTSGQYGFDSGCVAFSNPMDYIGKKSLARKRSAERWKEQGQKRKEKRSSKADFHTKHG